MEYELGIIKEFDNYCRKKREEISNTEDEEQKSRQEKVLVARYLLYQGAVGMVSQYSKYKSILKEGVDAVDFKNIIDNEEARNKFIRECEVNQRMSDVNQTQFSKLQDAMLCTICAGLEDISFNKWKDNVEDAICQVQSQEQVRRLPRFSNACAKIQDSLDIDFSDIEEELRQIFEPECIYNTLILIVTAVKLYTEILQGICENREKDKKVRHRKTDKKVHHKKYK